MTEETRPRRFDPWLCARGQSMARLIERVTAAVDAQEAVWFPRVRARKADAAANRRVVLEIITANLARAVLIPPVAGHILVSTGNKGSRIPRYTSPATGKPLRDLVFLFSEAGMALYGRPTELTAPCSLTPTEAFREAVAEAGISAADFRRHEREEVILLSTKTRGAKGAPRGQRIILDYPETAATQGMRARLRALNAVLDAADITFSDGEIELVDVNDRVMRRHFILEKLSDSPRLHLCGRLYGGFWQTLKRERRVGIRINGEGVTVLDYASLHPRLAYARQGVPVTEADLYAIPGLEQHREAVKVLVNTLFNDGHHSRATWPRDARVEQPKGLTVKQMRRAIWTFKPHLRHAFGRGLGLELQFTESRILSEVLERLRGLGIVALGLHDGMLVATSRADEARDVMEQEGRRIAGQYLPVTSTRVEPSERLPLLPLVGQLSAATALSLLAPVHA